MNTQEKPRTSIEHIQEMHKSQLITRDSIVNWYYFYSRKLPKMTPERSDADLVRTMALWMELTDKGGAPGFPYHYKTNIKISQQLSGQTKIDLFFTVNVVIIISGLISIFFSLKTGIIITVSGISLMILNYKLRGGSANLNSVIGTADGQRVMDWIKENFLTEDIELDKKSDPETVDNESNSNNDFNSNLMSIIISRDDILSSNINPYLEVLNQLISRNENMRSYKNRVEISFVGFNTREELWDRIEVRNFIRSIDNQFPYWLFFLSKDHSGLNVIIRCFLSANLKPEAMSEYHQKQLVEYLEQRGFPAMNQISSLAGLDEKELNRMTHLSIDYFLRYKIGEIK